MFRPDHGKTSVRVKICGITNKEDARCAIDCGADALGFNFFPGSKRFVDVRSAGSWISELSSEVAKVAVLVNPTWAEALAIAGLPFIDALQLHGHESEEFCRRLAQSGVLFAKAVPVGPEDSPTLSFSFSTRSAVLDSSREGVFGGSGRTFPWELGRRFISEHPGLEVTLAGGLTPENVAGAVRVVRPFAVDVTSGVEVSVGRKDPARIAAFMAAARS